MKKILTIIAILTFTGVAYAQNAGVRITVPSASGPFQSLISGANGQYVATTTGYFGRLIATSTTAINQINGVLNIGTAINPQPTSFAAGYYPFQISQDINDSTGLRVMNTNTGNQSMVTICMQNDQGLIDVPGIFNTDYGCLLRGGSNFDLSMYGITAIGANDMALFTNGPGDLVFGAIDPTGFGKIRFVVGTGLTASANPMEITGELGGTLFMPRIQTPLFSSQDSTTIEVTAPGSSITLSTAQLGGDAINLNASNVNVNTSEMVVNGDLFVNSTATSTIETNLVVGNVVEPIIGSLVFFEKTDYGSEIDTITATVALTRGDSQGLFNSVSEMEYTGEVPGTLWSKGTCAAALSFGQWDTTVAPSQYSSISAMLADSQCMKTVAEEEYYDIKYLSWTSGGGGGGFSYNRTQYTYGYSEGNLVAPNAMISGTLDVNEAATFNKNINVTGSSLTNTFSGPVVISTATGASGHGEALLVVDNPTGVTATMRFQSQYAKLQWFSSSATTNQGKYQVYVNPSGQMFWGMLNDAENAETNFLRFDRTGTTPTAFLVDSGNQGMRMGVGVTSATARLHLPAGTTATGRAPLKFNSGSLMSSPEVGAVEFLTNKWYGTITTGTARKEFTLNDIALTSGRIPYATTDGRLTDDSLFVFTGSNLGIGTTSPVGKLHVTAGASATTTVSFGTIGASGSKVCHNTKNTDGTDISFYFVGTTMVVENNLCN
jgi:hypothetical protein